MFVLNVNWFLPQNFSVYSSFSEYYKFIGRMLEFKNHNNNNNHNSIEQQHTRIEQWQSDSNDQVANFFHLTSSQFLAVKYREREKRIFMRHKHTYLRSKFTIFINVYIETCIVLVILIGGMCAY